MHIKSLMNSSNGTILGTDFFGVEMGRDMNGIGRVKLYVPLYLYDYLYRESKATCTGISI